jgi:colanic acid/amylovoran biosynthesis glycosyltransferase
MKVAVVVGTFPKLSETFVLNHIIGLIKNGFEVTIFATNKGSLPYHPDVSKYNLLDKVIFRPNPHVGAIKRLFLIIGLLCKNKQFLFKLLQTFRPKYYGSFALKGYFFFEAIPFLKFKPDYFDIIHTHFGENGNKLAYLKETGIINSPLIVNFHGHDVNHIELIKKQKYYKALNKSASALIFNSKYLMQKFKKVTHIKLPTYQVPVGINTELFSSNNKSVNTKTKLITIGRLVDCKGIELVIEALTAIDRDKFEYHIVGDGPNKNDLKQLTSQKNLDSNITFHGAITQPTVIDLLQKSDMFILFGITDKYGEIDAQGLVVQEAQACGIPVIVSDGGGLPEGVLKNETGLIIKEGDVKELKNVLLKVINKNINLDQMAINARKFIENTYSIDMIDAKIRQVYSNVLS